MIPLDGAGNQAVADIAEASAAIFVRDGRAEQAERAHFPQDVAVEMLVEISLGYARLQLFLGVGLGRVADDALMIVELVVDGEGVFPVEWPDLWLAHALLLPRINGMPGL